MGGYEKLRRSLGRRHHRRSVSQGVRQLSIMGSHRHRGDRVYRSRHRSGRERGHRSRGPSHDRVPAVALLALLLLAGCDSAARKVSRHAVMPPPVKETFEAIDSPSMQFLPRQQEAPGWRLEEDPLVLRPGNLVTYLDHDARHFLDYGVVDLTVGKYAATAGSGFANAEIFRFPDFVKAFGAYSTGKVAGINFLDIQNESFVRAHSLHIWRGPYYIRITGSGNGDSVKALGAFIADKMPPAPGKPAVFSFFPEQARVLNSERYSADSGFNKRFLGNSFQVSFDSDGQPAEGLVVPAASRAVAAQIMDMYRSAYV